MKLSKREDGCEFYVTSDGFSFGDFNKAGKVDLWRMAKHFEIGRAASFSLGFHQAMQLSRKVSVFVRFQSLELSPEFYARVTIATPWKMTSWISYIGRTSYYLDSVTRCQESGVELARSVCQAVRVDRVTHRPVPLPEEGIAPYRKTTTMKESPKFEFSTTVPDQVAFFTFSTQALPSDVDSNLHVNQSICIKYCMDCASLAATHGDTLQNFTRDMAFYNVNTFAVEYVSEMNVGDAVDVLCWEDPKECCVLWFIVKIGDKTACRCKGKWFSDANGKPVERLGKSINSLPFPKL